MFSQAFVCSQGSPSWGWVGVWPGGGGRACLVRCRSPPPREMATDAVGMHPTGMHYCSNYFRQSNNKDSLLCSKLLANKNAFQ